MVQLLLALFTPQAQAFCGVYVGGAGAELYNEGSQVVLVREGQRTTLTMVNDYEGPATEFALLIPVPEVPGPDDVKVVDPAVVERLDVYSAPRLVSYTCDQLHGYWDYASSGGGIGCRKDYNLESAPPQAAGEDASSVVVEAEFAVGEYEIVILSTEESGDLLVWLDDNGYSVPDSTSALLTEYIEAGSFFFAAKVKLEGELNYASFLSPLQVSYTSEVLTLPLRLGTANSAGEQDLVVYTITDMASGQVSVSNYPEAQVETECMARLDEGQTLGDFYVDRVADALPGETGAAWMLEYTWAPASCDPCTEAGPLADEDVTALGFSEGVSNAHFTRLHMRYTPEALTQDPVFYASGSSSTFQVRYIQYNDDLESDFPICTEGWAENPGTCDEELENARTTREGSVLPGVLATLTLGAAVWLRRRFR